MNGVGLTCKIITPMFMYGANKKIPELRATEFKGMMRFWWRAVRALDNGNALRREESHIFGIINENGSKASAVKVIVFPQPSDKEMESNILLKNSLDEGIRYLFYSVFFSKEAKYIKDSFIFQVILNSWEEKYLKDAVASLWSAIYLGGFGQRSRRGAGNVIVTDAEGKTYGIEFIPKGKNSEEVAEWLVDNFKKVRDIITKGEKTNFASSYSNLSISRFIISSSSFDTWQEALSDIGNRFKDFRKEHESRIFDSAVFGLPIFHRGKPVKGFKRGNNEETFERRMSPLIFKVIEVEDKYYWLVIRLAGEFLPEGSVLKFNNNTQKPDYVLIEEFWNRLKDKNREYILNYPFLLEEIMDKLKKELNPQKIYLYGSRARGNFGEKSDIDIAVESGKSIENLDLVGAFDVVNFSKASKKLKEKILKEGISIYEREN